MIMIKFPKVKEEGMKMVYNSLSEKDRRHFAAVISLGLGWGGRKYICEILDCDPRVIKKGLKELENGLPGPDDRIRAEGGGRKKIIETTDNVDDVFLKVLKNYTAGDPMDEKVKWTNLNSHSYAGIWSRCLRTYC